MLPAPPACRSPLTSLGVSSVHARNGVQAVSASCNILLWGHQELPWPTVLGKKPCQETDLYMAIVYLMPSTSQRSEAPDTKDISLAMSRNISSHVGPCHRKPAELGAACRDEGIDLVNRSIHVVGRVATPVTCVTSRPSLVLHISQCFGGRPLSCSHLGIVCRAKEGTRRSREHDQHFVALPGFGLVEAYSCGPQRPGLAESSMLLV